MQAFMWQDDKIGIPRSIMLVCERSVRVKHLISLVWLEKDVV